MRNNYLLSLLRTPRRAIATALATGLAVSALSGCAIQQLAGSNEPATQTVGELDGKAMGGNTPIGGATVTLYASAVNTSISSGTYVGTALFSARQRLRPAPGAFTFGTVPPAPPTPWSMSPSLVETPAPCECQQRFSGRCLEFAHSLLLHGCE